ncbi:hypothetical protein C8R47DRAFT_1158845 [Mycena vitilis]|nr:hypothetical protein C8R47DRAFT_1158845 [Mycena vitilis]
MNTDPRRPLQDNENGYEHPHRPTQARQAPTRQASRPTMHPSDSQQSRPDQYQQPQRQQQYTQQPHGLPVQQRPQHPLPSRPVLQDQRTQQPLQRQPSRPDQPPQLQRQPSRPDQHYPPAPMADPYTYKELPLQPQAQPGPALMRAPSTPFSLASSSSQYSSQTTLAPPIRPYAEDILIRSNSDDELDKTDVFWRRFNANAAHQQQPDAEKSSWLEKNEGKSSRHNRTLWIVGFIFVLLAAGGIGIGIFLSFRNPSNASRPDALGGSADITSAGGIAATVAGGSGGGADAAATTSSALHVTPTNTVA